MMRITSYSFIAGTISTRIPLSLPAFIPTAATIFSLRTRDAEHSLDLWHPRGHFHFGYT
jgi:hypothetical protein